MKCHLFRLDRRRDVSGNSGTGDVAHALVIPSGKVIMWWNTEISSINIYDSITNVQDLHSHEGATLVKAVNSPAELLELFGFEPSELLRKRKRRKKD